MKKSEREYGKRCQLCFKYREARMYPFKIKGRYRRLCKACWEREE